MDFQNQLKKYILSLGADDVGFAEIPDNETDMRYAICIVIHLSEAVIDEIGGKEPTHTYFHHYRTVNAYIDRTILQIGMYLQKSGYSYIPVGASQSINSNGWHYAGRYSAKKVAVLAGLGTIGKSTLFLHKMYGPCVRLGILFTDCKLQKDNDFVPEDVCGTCSRCVWACPAQAIKGTKWHADLDREDMFLPERCSTHMKKAYQHIGRGAVCGICMSVCPMRRKNKEKR